MTLSLQTVNEELYESLEDSKHFKKVLERIVNLAKSVRENKVNQQVVAQYMDLPENKPHQMEFRDFCNANGITMQIIQRHEWGDKFESGLIDRANRYPCPYLWLYPTVTHIGNLVPCSIDFFDEIPYGSLKGNTVAEVWSGNTATNMRGIHQAARWDEIPMCRNCTQWSKIPNIHLRQEDGSFQLSE